MAGKFSHNLKYIFSTIRSSFLPALFFLCALTMFYADNPYSDEMSFTLHYLMLITAATAMSLLYFANQSKPLFSLLVGFAGYLVINNLKLKYGAEYIDSAEFRCVCFALPLNFILLYFLPQTKLRIRRNVLLLLFILTQAFILQKYGSFINNIPHLDILLEAVSLWACVLWCLMLGVIALNISFKNTIINTGLFYADTCLFMGLLYSQTSSGLTTFFLGFTLIIFCTVILDLYHRYHYDTLENVNSKVSFANHAVSKFPFKYSVALFSIDNRDKLQTVLGEKKLHILEQMLINRILEMQYEVYLYRYNDSELMMVFYENARHTKEFVENIRHNIAATEFIFASHKSIKITISSCISEKTRKDLYASEVTERARNALHKNHRFNCNIITVVS